MVKKWDFFEAVFFSRFLKNYFGNAPETLEGRKAYQMHMKMKTNVAHASDTHVEARPAFIRQKASIQKIRALAEVLATLASALRALAEVIFIFQFSYNEKFLNQIEEGIAFAGDNKRAGAFFCQSVLKK